MESEDRELASLLSEMAFIQSTFGGLPLRSQRFSCCQRWNSDLGTLKPQPKCALNPENGLEDGQRLALEKRKQLAALAISESEYNRRELYLEDRFSSETLNLDGASENENEVGEGKILEDREDMPVDGIWQAGSETKCTSANLSLVSSESAGKDSVTNLDLKKSVRARLHKTGARIYLAPCPADEPASTRRYILCSGCATAYVGNAINASTLVKCPVCRKRFSVSPSTLQVSLDPDIVSEQAKAVERNVAAKKAKADEIFCEHFSNCPGCVLETRVGEPAVARKASAFVRNALGLNRALDIRMGPATRWRTHAKLAIRPSGMGLFKNRSHDVVEIPDCAVHHPAINAAAEALQKCMKAHGVRPYDEERRMGRARYALFTVERSTGLVQVTIVWNASSWKDANPVAPRLGSEYWENNRDLLHSVWFNWNTTGGNAITSQKDDAFYRMHGPALLRESVCGAKVYFAPTVFRQANLDAFETLLVPKLLSYIPEHSSVVELYGGVGVISLAALKQQDKLKLSSLTVTEINPFAAAPFKKALTQFHRSVSDRVKFVVGSDDETVDIAVNRDADLVIVDPPRAGVSDACLEELAEPSRHSPLRRLIYVSCGYEAFQRDSRRLVTGQWHLAACHGFVLFPGSNHLEILAVFERNIK